jgi:hypothetical protein
MIPLFLVIVFSFTLALASLRAFDTHVRRSRIQARILWVQGRPPNTQARPWVTAILTGIPIYRRARIRARIRGFAANTTHAPLFA